MRDVRHRLAPSGVVLQVEGRDLQAIDIGAMSGHGLADLMSLVRFAYASPDGVAILQELQGDMPAKETGNASDEDAIAHFWPLGSAI